MKQAMVLRRRRAERLARARRRDAWLAAGSLLLHLLIFLLLPGLAMEITPHHELLIELVRPAGGGRGHSQSSPAPAKEPGVAQTETALATEQAPTPNPQPAAAAVPTPSDAQAKTPPAPSQPAASSAAINEATAITAKPVTVKESPQQVEDQPVAQPATEVIDEPVRQPEAQAATPVAPTQPHSQPAPSAPAPDAETDAEPAPVDSSAPAGEEPATAEDTTAGDAGGEDQAEAGDGGEDAGDGPPPGPSAAELRLLGEYGDAARLRIRSQARNPEQGGNGIVTFEFEVAHDGHLIDVRVVRTSGYANLDNDALEATRAAFNERKEKVPFPSDVTVASWVFVMSMKYPLY